jgi:hypothetical protein
MCFPQGEGAQAVIPGGVVAKLGHHSQPCLLSICSLPNSDVRWRTAAANAWVFSFKRPSRRRVSGRV